MEVFKVDELSPEQFNALTSFIRDIIYHALDKQELDGVWQSVDLALKQSYRDVGLSKVNLNEAGASLNALTAFDNEEADDFDEFSELYTPLIYKTFKGWVTHLKEAVIPRSGAWFSVDRRYSTFFDEMGLTDFLPVINNCWEENLDIENERFAIKRKIGKAIAQYVAYGATPGITYYDGREHYVDIRVMPLRDYGIYPISDDWKKSNNVFRYDINYSDLLEREDLNQDFIKMIKPNTDWNTSDKDVTLTPTDRSNDYENFSSPFGKVRLHDIWIPSLYIEGHDQFPDIITSGCYFTVAYNPQLKRNVDLARDNNGSKIFILKGSQRVKTEELTMLFAAFDETLPGQHHGKGPLIPFLVYQAVQNQLISGMARDMAFHTDPAVVFASGEKDIDDTPLPKLGHGAVYEGVQVTPVIIPGFDQRLQAYLLTDKHLTEKVEEASGMSKIQLGGRPGSRRTKFEVQEQVDAGSLRINEVADMFDEGFLKPFIVARIIQTQHQLRSQVETGLEYILDMNPAIDQQQAMDLVLENNGLFQRLLNFTSIAPKYEEFYKQNQDKLNKNNQYVAEFQSLMQQINQLQQQMSEPFQTFREPADITKFDKAAIDTARDQFYQIQEQQKQQMQSTLTTVTEKMKTTQLAIDNVKEIPEPSNYIYYLLLSHPIDESDVVIEAAKSTMNKSMLANSIVKILQTIPAVAQLSPDSVNNLDINKMVESYVTNTGIPYENVKKSTTELIRSEQKQAQQQQMQLQLQTQQNASQQQ